MVNLDELVKYSNDLLAIKTVHDFCPNGLQVRGKSEIKKLAAAVTASENCIDLAIDEKADALLVHHGYFWKGESPCIDGMKYARIKKLINNDISLICYHLPLDVNVDYGNNYELGRLMGWHQSAVHTVDGGLPILFEGKVPDSCNLQEFSEKIATKLVRQPLVIGDLAREVKRVAWCTGAAQSYLPLCRDLGVDVYVSGEISERTVHEAREYNIAYIAAGHHATERYGVQALGNHLQSKFALDFVFLDEDNPV